MRFAIFSDVHANRQAWEAVLADAQRQRAGTLVCLGDVVGYGPRPLEVLSSVRASTVNFVLGNHDAAACGRLDPSIFNDRAREVIEWTRGRLDAEALEFLQQVPLEMDAEDIQFVHAEIVEPGEFGYIDGVTAASPNLRAMEKTLAFIGHTHLPTAFAMARRGGPVTQLPPLDFSLERGKRYIVNVGSVGEPRTTDVRASYVIYDDKERTITFRKVAFDVDGYLADLTETGLDIKPYFVRVVEAGRHKKPPPVASPQLALSHLPKVAESVAGHRGSLVVGAASGMPGRMAVAGRTIQGVRQPRTAPAWLMVLISVLAVAGLGGLGVFLMSGGKEGPGSSAPVPVKPAQVTRGEAEPARAPREARDPSRPVAKSDSSTRRPVRIRRLTIEKFEGEFPSLAEFREQAEAGGGSGKIEVADGLLGLEDTAGEEHYALVWEGNLVVPKAGEYRLTLDADDCASLRIGRDSEEVLRLEQPGPMGRPRTATVKLGMFSNPFRLEFLQMEGEQGLNLTVSGAALEEAVSLMRSPSPMAIASNRGEDVMEQGNRKSPAPTEGSELPEARKLSEGLAAYWPLDSRAVREHRFIVGENGDVRERLISATHSKVQVLVPGSDPGKAWRDLEFDTKAAGWTTGKNGIGYQDTPGRLMEFIQTPLGGEPRRRPHAVYIRIPFEVDDPAVYSPRLLLRTRHVHGFVAYLNGSQRVSTFNVPGSLQWNSGATRSEYRFGEKPDEKTIKTEYLRKGTNVLAIHALNFGGEEKATNDGCTSPVFLIQPELLAQRPGGRGIDPDADPPHYLRRLGPKAIHGDVGEEQARFGEGLEFVKGHVVAGQKEATEIGKGSFAVSLWFTRKPEGVDNQMRRILSTGAWSNKEPGWTVYLSKKASSVAFVIGDGRQRQTFYARTGKGAIADGKWRHYAVVVDRRTGKVRSYLDGKKVGEEGIKQLKKVSIESHTGLQMGGSGDDRVRHRGMLDDVALWKRALRTDEISRIHGGGGPLGEVLAADGR